METIAGLPVLLFETQQDWRIWLGKNHGDSKGAWLKIAKKVSGMKSVSYVEALDDALCYGWIDSQKRGYDEKYFLQKFGPRGPRSIWSKINIEKVERLIEVGSMQAAGLAAIERAKQTGEWGRAYDSSSKSVVPEDFQAALDKNLKAKAFFETLNKTNTYVFIWRVQTAKKPETRKARIEKFIGMMEKGEKLH